jgi:pyruvate/2-oxoacid:ferredoxin oxidoreductase alpha subunit
MEARAGFCLIESVKGIAATARNPIVLRYPLRTGMATVALTSPAWADSLANSYELSLSGFLRS